MVAFPLKPMAQALAVLLASTLSVAHAVERVQEADRALDCAGIGAEQERLRGLVAAGNEERTLGTAAAGTAANVGTQVAAGQVAGSLFGALGGLATRLAGATAQATVETKMGPDEAAKTLATQATARQEFLTRLAAAKDCASGGPGTALSPEAFNQVAAAPPAGTIAVTALSAQSVEPALGEPIVPLDSTGLVDGKIDLKGKTIHLTEYRVLFDVGGEVSGNTRGGYLFGTDYGSTRATVTYSVSNMDVAAYQKITDRAFADFKERMQAAGIQMVYEPPEGGGIYEATEAGSTPEAPVFGKQAEGYGGRKMLVMVPTGTKWISRGIAGIGAGNIGRRIEWVKQNRDGMSVTQTVNIAQLESSGSGSSILRQGSSADASSEMTVGNPPSEFLIQMHAGGGLMKMTRPVTVPGAFANFRTVSTYDSDKDAAMRAIGVMKNMMGQGANKTVKVEKAVDIDGPSMARLSLQGLATVNQAIADRLK